MDNRERAPRTSCPKDGFFSHSPPDSNQEVGYEPYQKHSSLVAMLAGKFGRDIGILDMEIDGHLHDAGKLTDSFKRRLEGKAKAMDHSTMGALIAHKYGQGLGWEDAKAISLSCYSHHTGIPETGDYEGLLDLKKLKADPAHIALTCYEPREIVANLAAVGVTKDFLAQLHSIGKFPLGDRDISLMMDIRMRLSCLTDADFLATECWFEQLEEEPREGPSLDYDKAIACCRKHIARLSRKAAKSADKCIRAGNDNARKVAKLRNDLMEACENASENRVDLYTLSSPTGSGKTLAMLLFALLHAKKYGLKRVIVVLPFLVLVDQTVKVYRDVLRSLCKGSVVEDHSLVDFATDAQGNIKRDSPEYYLHGNWDSPVVITTTVQFFQSMFSNRPGACRKLHNIANSVILIDEIQTFPYWLIVPTMATLSYFCKRYNSTVVCSTATQPCFHFLDDKISSFGFRWRPTELVPAELNLFQRVRKTKVTWFKKPKTWDEIAERMVRHQRVCCVVNLKRHAKALIKALRREGVAHLFHVSTSMCPAHRRNRIKRIRALLRKGEPCFVVSTQCLETGADLDFPVIYRTMGPLEAIAQVAGRCNREGRLVAGKMFVFCPEEDNGYPSRHYGRCAATTEELLRKHDGNLDIDDPAVFEEYFKALYQVSDGGKLEAELISKIKERNFPEVKKQYRLIPDNTVRVLVCYPPCRKRFEKLMRHHDEGDEKGRKGITRQWLSRANSLFVQVYRPKDDKAPSYLSPLKVWDRKERQLVDSTDFFVLTENRYDSLLGLETGEDISLETEKNEERA